MKVVVVGAGIIGLATAWTLHRRGVDVQIVDPEPAGGASHAAAGMLAPASETVWGQSALHPLMIESAARYPRFVADLEAESAHTVGYLQTETLTCAADSADRRQLTELAQLQRDLGLPAELLTGSEARRIEPGLSPRVVAAVRSSHDHQVDPRRVTAALCAALGLSTGRSAGASAQGTAVRGAESMSEGSALGESVPGESVPGESVPGESVPGERADRSNRLVRARVTGLLSRDGATRGVRLEDGTELDADQVVLCAGVRQNEIDGAPQLPVRPVYGDVMRLRPPWESAPLTTRTVRGVMHGRSVYVVPREDGTLVLGATVREDGMSGVSARGVHELLRDAERMLPGVLDCEVIETIARARPGSPDDAPMIGRVDDGLVVSTGYFRHGILLTPLGTDLTVSAVLNGHLSAQTAADETRLAASVDPRRFA